MLVNNSTNINKINNYLSPQLMMHKTDSDVWPYKIQGLVWTGTKMWQG